MRANDRLLSILWVLGESGHPLSLTALADFVHLPKSTTLRFVRSLEPDGWIVRDGDGQYVLGPAVIALASQYLSSDPVLAAAPPLMRDLRDALGETISLSRVIGLERICLQEFPSQEALRLVLGVGSVGPLHAGASGLLLLAHLSPEVRREVYDAGLPRYTSITLTDPAALEEECAAIRERGWARTYGQKTAGGAAIAVSLSDPNAPGSVSALGIFGPQARFEPDQDERRWREALQECAATIERTAALHLRQGRAAT
ncbi:MAG: helix-turn-helix domain-containing protein [Nitriliruptorales bacterium]|nr:helix-turn-helix domain-containing protein [Nitriliruptorales bacterium]